MARGIAPRPGAAICLAGLIAGLAGLAAGRLAPLWIPLDIFNHFVVHLAVGAGACLLGLLMPRARLATAIAVTAIGVIAIGLWPHYAGRYGALSEPAAGERIVRVMVFNTHWENPDWRAVADEVVRHNPDIVALLEIGRSKLPLLEALEAVYPHRADCVDLAYCQIVVLSKFAIAASDSRSQWRGPPLVRTVYGPELGSLTVVAAHTIRPPFFLRQLEQMRALGEVLAAGGGARIVLGDLNAGPLSRMMETLTGRAGLTLATRLPTWPATAGLPQIAIDHILLSPDVRVIGGPRIGSPVGSDHYPVIAEIALPAP